MESQSEKPPISPTLDRAAGYAWRLLVVIVFVLIVAATLYHLRVVMVPVFIALLASTVLVPPVQFLERKGFRPSLATGTVFLVVGLLMAGIVFLLASPVANEFRDLGPQVRTAVDDVNTWLIDGPLALEQAQLDRYVDTIGRQLRENAGSFRTGIVSSATLAAEVFTGMILSIILTFFFCQRR